jgi:predicted RNase H-like HicB family nuclease
VKTKKPVEYVAIVERGEKTYGAYVPDLPGCVAVGETREEAAHLIREAIALHVAGLRRGGLPVPEPSPTTGSVEV